MRLTWLGLQLNSHSFIIGFYAYFFEVQHIEIRWVVGEPISIGV